MTVSFHNPVALSFLAHGEWKREVLEKLESVEEALVLYSKSAVTGDDSQGLFISRLEKMKHVMTVTGIESNPSVQFLIQLRKRIGKLPSLIIAIGGGSVIDVAKILVALDALELSADASRILKTIEMKEYEQYPRRNIELIALPSTSGTGSELTRWATIWDTENKKKFSVERSDLYPTESWIDPVLTRNAPANITVSTGLDALSHAVEAYWSVLSNPIVRRLSSQAISHVVKHLKTARDNPRDLASREGMSLASVFAGLSFSQTRTTACHALSYPLTVRFGVPHGIAVSMSLIEMMKINWNEIKEKEVFLASFHAASIEEIESWLHEIVDDTVPFTLRDYGVSEQTIGSLLEDTDFLQARLGNNPTSLSSDQLKDIYLNML